MEELDEGSTKDSKQSLLGANYGSSTEEDSAESAIWANAIPVPEAFPVEAVQSEKERMADTWTPPGKHKKNRESDQPKDSVSMDSVELMEATAVIFNSPVDSNAVPPQSSPWKPTPQRKLTEWDCYVKFVTTKTWIL